MVTRDKSSIVSRVTRRIRATISLTGKKKTAECNKANVLRKIAIKLVSQSASSICSYEGFYNEKKNQCHFVRSRPSIITNRTIPRNLDRGDSKEIPKFNSTIQRGHFAKRMTIATAKYFRRALCLQISHLISHSIHSADLFVPITRRGRSFPAPVIYII